MSIQSSMNALLGSSAILAHLAQPMRNAELLSREKEKEYNKIKNQTMVKKIEGFESMPPEAQYDTIASNLSNFGVETDYQSDYIDALVKMHEAAPGNPNIARRLSDAQELSPEMNNAAKLIREQMASYRLNLGKAEGKADFITKKMEDRGKNISKKGQRLGNAKIAKAEAMRNAWDALDERYSDILQ